MKIRTGDYKALWVQYYLFLVYCSRQERRRKKTLPVKRIWNVWGTVSIEGSKKTLQNSHPKMKFSFSKTCFILFYLIVENIPWRAKHGFSLKSTLSHLIYSNQSALSSLPSKYTRKTPILYHHRRFSYNQATASLCLDYCNQLLAGLSSSASNCTSVPNTTHTDTHM